MMRFLLAENIQNIAIFPEPLVATIFHRSLRKRTD